MAITFVGAEAAISGFSSSFTVDVPTGTQDDDVMLLLVTSNAVSSWPTPPSGWDGAGQELESVTENDLGTGTWAFLYQRTASSEPSSYTWNFPASHWHWGMLLVFRGVQSIRDSDSAFSSGTSLNIPSLTATSGDWLVAFGFNWQDSDNSFPAALTVASNPDGTGDSLGAYEEDLSGGSTNTYTFSSTPDGRLATFSVLLVPAATGPNEASASFSLTESIAPSTLFDPLASASLSLTESITPSTLYDPLLSAPIDLSLSIAAHVFGTNVRASIPLTLTLVSTTARGSQSNAPVGLNLVINAGPSGPASIINVNPVVSPMKTPRVVVLEMVRL